MARGWESKSVESQQEERERQLADAGRPELSAAEAARLERRRTLELALSRARADEARATAPAYRKMLAEAVAALQAQLDALNQERS